MDRGLLAFESLCQQAGSARCALAGGSAVAPRVTRLLARLRRAPILAPTASPSGALSHGDLSAVLFASLTNPAACLGLTTYDGTMQHIRAQLPTAGE